MHDGETISNPTDNPTLDDVVASRFSRRGMIGGSLAAAAVTFIGGSTLVKASPVSAATGDPEPDLGVDVFDRLGFTAITPSTDDDIRVPPGYSSYAILPWGTPLFSGVPDFDLSNTAADQEQQVGQGHDGMWFFETGDGEGVLAFNLEYAIEPSLFPDGDADWTEEKTLKSQNALGVCVARIAKVGGTWQLVTDAAENRRFTANSPMTFSGAAAGNALLRSADHPQGRTTNGTVNNCGSGYTPWGTYLTCEENFNGYFWDLGEGSVTPAQQALFDRYGIAGTGFGYQWATTDEAWRADLNPNRPNQYGWVVEIDPFDASSVPVKHTNLGRVKHESAYVKVDDENKIAVYMGDDERGEYIYKYVTTYSWPDAQRRGEHPFDTGRLYVAVFDADGTGEWKPLVHGLGPLTRSNGWMNQGDICVRTREAADAVGATRMDRPEWVSCDPTCGDVYVACTNNSRRGGAFPVDAANPRGPNDNGHIVRFRETDNDLKSTTFCWDIFMLAGPGNGVDGSTIPSSAAFGSPDSIWHDADGRLWIETDGSQPVDSNDQMLAADPLSGQIKRFLTGPRVCEITGATGTSDQHTMFVNVQHPGDGDPAASNWPDGGSSIPRPAVVVIEKDDGGVVGT